MYRLRDVVFTLVGFCICTSVIIGSVVLVEVLAPILHLK